MLAAEGGDVVPSALQLPAFEHLPEALVGLLPENPLASMVGGQMLQVILFAGVVGVALVNMEPRKSAPLFDLLGSIQEVCMKVVGFAMRLAPLAVLGLVAHFGPLSRFGQSLHETPRPVEANPQRNRFRPGAARCNASRP